MSLTKTDYNKSFKEITKTIEVIDAKLQKVPEGDLRIWKHRNSYEYCLSYVNDEGKRAYKYLNSASEHDLSVYANKMYLQKLRQALASERWALRVLAKVDFDKKGRVYDELPARVQSIVKPLYTSTAHKIEEWYTAPFISNTFDFGSSAGYVTELGEKVRSRAECLIANELHNAGLKYHYEEQLTLKNGKNRFPDFKVAHPKTGEYYYIEFFGMMDMPEYSENAFIKISEYANDPVYSKMIFIFDHKIAPFSNAVVKNILKQFFE